MSESMGDPLYAYTGEDREMRDEIERLLTAYVIRAAAGLYVPGTIYLANDIMALVKESGAR